MKPSQKIIGRALEKTQANPNSFDFVTVNGASLTKIVMEILNYLDEKEKDEN